MNIRPGQNPPSDESNGIVRWMQSVPGTFVTKPGLYNSWTAWCTMWTESSSAWTSLIINREMRPWICDQAKTFLHMVCDVLRSSVVLSLVPTGDCQVPTFCFCTQHGKCIEITDPRSCESFIMPRRTACENNRGRKHRRIQPGSKPE